MHPNFQKDEIAITKITRRYVTPTDTNKKLRLIIYYNKFKTFNLIVKNNSSPQTNQLQKTNVIYKFTCPLGNCISSDPKSSYIGSTTTTLSRRLTCHLYPQSSIHQPLTQPHCPPPSNMRTILNDNTNILHHSFHTQKLHILEALYIKKLQPSINKIAFESGVGILTCV